MTAALDDERRQAMLSAAHAWVVRMEDPDVSAADEAAFGAWLEADPLHADMYDRAVTVAAALKRLNKDDIDAELHYQVREKPAQSPRPPRSHWFKNLGIHWGIGAAALLTAAALVVMIPLLNFQQNPVALDAPITASYESATGETKSLTLPDGTKVTLGARTKIDVAFDDRRRMVTLSPGAAFFDVATDSQRPFSVKTAKLTATALGTQFDVRNSAGVFRVAVAEGKVEVRYPLMIDGKPGPMNESARLEAGQEALATEEQGLQPVRAVDTARVGSWRSDRLIYQGASVAEFIADLNRYSDTPITIDPSARNIAERRVSGVFRGQEVESLLFSLTEIHPLDIDQSRAGEIVLRHRDDG